MFDTITQSLPNIIQSFKNSIYKEPMAPDEYYHRIIDIKKRQVIDIKHESMKEIVEKVYYNAYDPESTEHYLIKKNPNTHTENAIRLKCNGYCNVH